MARKTGKLTRADLDKIVDGMSARDIFRASTSNGTNPESGNQQAEVIFDMSAERQGYGKEALDRVHISDAAYLSNLLAESLNLGGPKAEGTDQSPTSADTGDSAPS